MTLDADSTMNQVVPSTSTIPLYNCDSSHGEQQSITVNLSKHASSKPPTFTTSETRTNHILRFVPITASFSPRPTVLTTTTCAPSTSNNNNSHPQPVFVQIGSNNSLKQQEGMMFVPMTGQSSNQNVTTTTTVQRPLILVPVCPTIKGSSSVIKGSSSVAAAVDARSLQMEMSRNREALRVKLQHRPPKGQLVRLGILPVLISAALRSSLRLKQRLLLQHACGQSDLFALPRQTTTGPCVLAKRECLCQQLPRRRPMASADRRVLPHSATSRFFERAMLAHCRRPLPGGRQLTSALCV
uniref:Uncharacterized protein n=1 Tax=Plectus sambesii TaxID=2011161 RepID=A0A914WQV6_9BILA